MLAASTEELNAVFRQEVGDVLVPGITPADDDRLWKDYEVYSYMTEAADAVATITEKLQTVLSITLAPNQQMYALPANVLHIRSARLLTGLRELREHNYADYGQLCSDDYGRITLGNQSMFTAVGNPYAYMLDYVPGALYILPIPAVADTLVLQCITTLPAPLLVDADLPFSDVISQRLMLLKMKALAYAKHDADTFDMKRSADFEAEFDMRAGAYRSEVRRQRRAPGTVRMEW